MKKHKNLPDRGPIYMDEKTGAIMVREDVCTVFMVLVLACAAAPFIVLLSYLWR